MEKKGFPERVIQKSHLDKFLKQTKNMDALLNKLLGYDVLSSNEVEQINSLKDDSMSCRFMYEILFSKFPDTFHLVLFSLRDTDNEDIADFLESEENISNKEAKNQSTFPETYSKQETKSLLVTGAEMGIAEIIEDYSEFRTSFNSLSDILKLRDINITVILSGINFQENFVLGATLILKEWTKANQETGNVENLCKLFEAGRIRSLECTERIKRMFDNYIDSGFAFDFPGHFTIAGKEEKIAHVINDNPSFCLYPERLYLLLNLPFKSIASFTKENMFISNATKMLKEWSELNPETSSVDHLAALLAFNGHFCTAEKISNL